MDKTGDGSRTQIEEPASEQAAAAPGAAEAEALRNQVIEAVSTVYDPEIPVNIYELGLIYGIEILPGGEVEIAMTLTSPACPVAGWLPIEVQTRVREVEGVTDAYVELVWDPPWTPDMMTEAARLELGMM